MAKRNKRAKTTEMEPEHVDNGAEAHAKGLPITANPFQEGDEYWDAWNEQWENAAEIASAQNAAATTAEVELEEEDEEASEEPAERSVVKAEFRARYAEAGHPSHCGDELAVLLNNLCLAKGGIDMERFEHICEANGVDLLKYNRTTKGWQGRLRMTGRNMLAGKVFANGGVVKTVILREDAPNVYLEGAEPEYKMSAEWMAGRRKVKAA